MLGRIAADAWGWTEKLGGEKNQVVKIRTEVDDEEVDALQAEIAKLDGDEVRIRAVVDKSSLRDIDGLADYAVSQSKNGKSISFEGVNQLNNDYIAKQAHGFAGVNTAIEEYNRLKTESTEKANKFAETIGKSNANLEKYLLGLKNTTGGMGGYALSLVGATAKTVVLEAASMALNAVLSMGISVAIQAAIAGIAALGKWVDDLIVTEEELNQNLEELESEWKELSSTIQDSAKSFRDLKTSADDIIPKYAKLAQGVDKYGKNISLTDEEYKEFVSLNNQLGQMFPELVNGYDSNGNAILSLSGDVDTLTESLYACVEAQRAANMQTIADTMPDVISNITEQMDTFESKIDKLKDKQEELRELYDFIKDNNTFEGTAYGYYDTVDKEDLLKKYGISYEREFVKSGGKDEQNTTYKYTIDWKQFETEFNGKMAGFDKESADLENRMGSAWKKLNPVVSAWLSTDYLFQDIDKEGQDIISRMIGEVDFKSLGLFTANGVKNYIENNIISPIYDMDDASQKAFFEIFNIQDALKNGEIDVQEYKDKISEILTKGNFSDEFKNLFKAVFNFDNPSELISETTKNVDKMTVSIGDLKSASDGLKVLGTAFKEMSDDGRISLDTLENIKTTFSGSVDDIDSYIDRLMKAKVGSQDFNSALSELTYGYINQKLNTEQLANADEAYIATLLKEVGVSNSAQVAQHMIAVAKEKLRLETQVLSATTASEINDLMNEEGATNATKQAIIELTREKVELNAQKIDSSDDIEELMGMAKAAGMAAESYAVLTRLKESGITDMDMDTFVGPLSPAQQAALDDWNKLKAGEVDFKWDDITSYGYTPKTYYTNTGSGKSGSDNTPDYEDPTDAIINRINLRSKELEQQEEYIQNQIEIAELENDYKKQISLTNDKLDVQKQKVDALKIANAELHQVAEDLRNGTPDWNEEEWFDSQGNETEAYIDFINRRIKAGADKEEIEAIKTQFEKIKKLKEAWVDNAEEITELNKEILQDEKDIADTREESYNEALDEIQRYADRVSDYYDKINEGLDKQIQAKEAILQITQKQTDATGNLMDAQTEIDKALRDAKLSTQYLTKEEREKIFNEDDYNKLSSIITTTQNDINTLTADFMQQIEDAYANDQLYLVEAITAEYERQVAMKERELEIAQAQVDLAKKQLQLNNVLAEKNVKQLVERNGQFVWEWVANTDDVRRATEELMDAEAKIKRAEYDKNQQLILDGQQSVIDGLNSQKGLNDYRVEVLNGYIDDISLAIENSVDPIKDFASISALLDGASSDVLSAFNKITSFVLGTNFDTGKEVSPEGGEVVTPPIGAANARAWVPGVGNVGVIIKNGKTQNELPINTIVFTDGGAFKITGGTPGNYTSDPVNIEDLTLYANGTNKTKSGAVLMGEKEPEMYIDNNGHLVPINQPTFANIDAGGIVFNQDQMANLRSLWDMSNIGKISMDGIVTDRASLLSQPASNDTIFNGDINVYSPHDYNDFVRALTQRMKQKSI